MENNFIPQRGIHFDDVMFSAFLKDPETYGMSNPQFNFVFCPANANHSDDFIGISVTGYGRNGKLVSRMLYPAKACTDADVLRLFNVVTDKEGNRHYSPKVVPTEVFGRATYLDELGNLKDCIDDWGLKWSQAVETLKDGENYIKLSGEKRGYVTRSSAPAAADAEL